MTSEGDVTQLSQLGVSVSRSGRSVKGQAEYKRGTDWTQGLGGGEMQKD